MNATPLASLAIVNIDKTEHTQNFTHSFSLVAHQVTSTNGPCKSEAKAWLKELLKLCCLHERNDATEGIAAQSWLFFSLGRLQNEKKWRVFFCEKVLVAFQNVHIT